MPPPAGSREEARALSRRTRRSGSPEPARHPPVRKAYKKGRKKRREASDDEAETSADESRADPGTGEPEQMASAAEGTLGRGTRRAAASTEDYGGPVARRRRTDDGEAEQTRRARRGREQDFAEINRRMYEEIRSSRDPRDHVACGRRLSA